MNNIYKVIWSKAKNCYVVASEIARSHTKSATGSGKIGGVTRRSLLASLMALSLLCGGLGVASAADVVHVDESATGAAEVYTKTGVDTLLNDYGKKTDVDNNKNNIGTLRTTTMDQGQKITANATNIARNTADIEKKIDKENADAKYATKTELIAKADATALDTKADKDTVTALDGRVGGVEGKVTALETTVGDDSNGLVREVNELKNQGNTLNNALGNKADKNELDAAKAKITANEGNITALQNKTAKLSPDGTALNGMTTVETGALKVTGGISNGTGVTTTLTDIDNSMKQTATNTTAINDLKTKTTTQQNAIDGLDAKTTKITYDVAKGTNVDGVTFNAGKVTGVTSINGIDIGDAQVDMKGKNLTGVGTINGTKIGTNVDGNYIHQDHSIWGNMKNVDTQVGKNAEAIAQEKTDREAADTDLSKRIGTVTDDGKYIKKSDTNSVSDNLKVLDTQAKTNADAIAQETADRKAAIGQLTVNGHSIEKDKNVSDNLVNLDNQAKVNADAIVKTDKRTGGIKRNLEGNQTTIEDKVTVNHSGDVAGVKGLSAETITTTGNASIGGDLKVAGTITTDKMVFGDKATNNYTEIDKGHITSQNDALAGDATKKSSSMELDHSKLEVGVADKDSNGHLTMTADKTSIKNSDLTEKNYSEIVADKDSVKTTVKDEKGNTTSTKSSATEIRNYAKDKDGNKTINVQTATQNKSWAKDKDGNESSIVQTGKDITNTAEKGTIKNDAMNIENNASGNITNNAQNGTIKNEAKDIVNNATGDITNTVGGKLTTTVTGQATENFNGGLNTTVTGAENHTVTEKQTNTVKGGQENIISGGQINNITGDQTTTVTGKVTENYKAGQATNVTGDQDINVSGAQTTTATDINRNASSGMIDTIDNDYGTNTETKVAGKTTTDVSIKGTGEEGKYIRGANESRDYLIKGTLKNSETKTVEKTSTEITDGTNKASTIQKVTDLAGSVTNGKETGVSGIHANKDGSVSIDSAVTDGTNTSVQNQTASQIAAAVKDGAGNENASVANATASANTIKSGSKANTVISTADGTSFINSDAMTPVTGASGVGTAKNTTIKGNTITTGKVTMDYADVMKDLGVRGNANITGKTTTGSLEVTGTSTLKGDVTMGSNATVNGNFTVNGTTNLKNTNVVGKLDVTQEATFHDSVSIAKDLSVGGDVTANSYKVGDKTYIDKNGIHANGQKITDVADGSISEGSKDAVNGGQLYTVKNDLEGKVNKVGANAAAMANLHPMEFDPDSKWNVAAAIGNYGSETAAALGAFYRPNDDVMVNLSTAFGTGENMVGGGVSVRLGKSGNKLSREENNALKAQVDDLTARMDALLSVLNPNMSKDFPDVPENHWAYEAVSRLAGNDIVQGYPDGEFHGERTMTRYEMAEIIYNALSRGAEAEKELVEEFKPELQAMAASEKATAERAEG